MTSLRPKYTRIIAKTLLVSICVDADSLGAQVAQPTTPVPASVTCTQRPTSGNADHPHPVCPVKAVVTRGPYLHAPTDTSATIPWMTDLPAHSRVLYRVADQPEKQAFTTVDGMKPVSTLHTIRIGGLKPGQKYEYRVAATPVLDLPAYWPKTGVEMQSDEYSFTTFDTRKSIVKFASVSDTHESIGRIDTLMQRIQFDSLDFLVQTGDAFNGVSSEAQVWDHWLSPLINGALHQSIPLILARGNHDTRGPFARELAKYVPIEENRFYFSRDVGPVHLLVIDTGEDKPDSTQVYASLNRFEEYRDHELAWFKRHTSTHSRARSAPFRIVVMHQPTWGWGWISPASDSARAAWTRAANVAGVDLVIAGHNHRFSFTPAGAQGRNYPVLVVGQDQIAKVQATAREIRVQLIGKDGSEVTAFTVPARRK
ncbi:MAG: metallophosphoesterase family protein [Phycisphaerae bacterium]|nr:metallophosphoesterase family protein [Gemmatimonadaceae bacterium]